MGIHYEFVRRDWGGEGECEAASRGGVGTHLTVYVFVSNFLTSHSGSFDPKFISRSIKKKLHKVFSTTTLISLLISCSRSGDNPKLMFAQKLTRVSRADTDYKL